MRLIKALKFSAAVLIMMLLLSGCMSIGGESVGNKRLVSAMGFDKSGEEITLLLETAEAETEGKVSPRILKKTGRSLESLETLIESESPRTLDYGHMSVIILGEELAANQREEIFNYLSQKSEIPLSTRVVSASSANEILSFKNEEGESSGYELSRLLEKTAEKLGIAAHSALYEIQTARLQNINMYGLPFIEISDESFCENGMNLFSDDQTFGRLNYEQTVVYTLLRNVFEGGEVMVNNGVYSVSSANTEIKAYLSEERLKIEIKVRAGEQSEELAGMIERNLKKDKLDIYGIKEVISNKSPELWAKIEKAYSEYYKNAEISVVGE